MKTAILIKTLGRERCLFNTLDSIEAFCDVPYRLYIADDGPVSDEKAIRYDQLRRDGHLVIRLDRPTAVTTARNMLARLVEDEKALLRIDDDFEFFDRTNIRAMWTVLESDPTIGVVADVEVQCGDGKGVRDGELCHGQGFIEIRDKVLYKRQVPVSSWPWLQAHGVRYALADYTRNFLLIRRQCAESCPWDERNFILSEHLDFMMSIVANGWKLAFTPDSVHKHRDDLARPLEDEHYQALRQRACVTPLGTDVFLEKWDLKKFETVRPVGRHVRDAKRMKSRLRRPWTFLTTPLAAHRAKEKH
jgi:glycosyltransferase involved in cell wall biosynthesis